MVELAKILCCGCICLWDFCAQHIVINRFGDYTPPICIVEEHKIWGVSLSVRVNISIFTPVSNMHDSQETDDAESNSTN